MRDEQRECRHRAGTVGEGGGESAGGLLAALGREAWVFRHAEDAQAFYDEISHMLLHQMCRAEQPAVV